MQKDDPLHPSWLPQEMLQCDGFANTASIVDGLDLVISIDSAMAHLAAALGKPVWLLLPKVVDWRWQLSGEHTPWYPTMRLYRQTRFENREQVAQRVAAALTLLQQAGR